jgi:hypothetical protein
MRIRFGTNVSEFTLRGRDVTALQLAADDYLAGTSTPWTWKTDLAMSRPIVVSMDSSSESWEP